MLASDQFIKENRFWLFARGYGDKGLHNPGSLENFIKTLKSNMSNAVNQEGFGIKRWKQEMTGLFEKGKYSANFSFEYAFRPQSRDFGLIKVAGSMFAEPAQTFPLLNGRLQELPYAQDVFAKVLMEFSLKIQSQLNQIKNESPGNRKYRRP